MNQTSARTRGVHHVGLTVPDLAAAKAFFVDALGFEQVGEVADYPAVFLNDGSAMITLWQAEDPANATPSTGAPISVFTTLRSASVTSRTSNSCMRNCGSATIWTSSSHPKGWAAPGYST